jgi:hypothetical protein
LGAPALGGLPLQQKEKPDRLSGSFTLRDEPSTSDIHRELVAESALRL